MAMSKEEILDAIANMTVMEVVELIAAMEEKFGVTAAAAVVAAPAAAGGGEAAAAEEQTEFNVVLTAFGENKVNVIKAVRAVTGQGRGRGRSHRAEGRRLEGRGCQDQEGPGRGWRYCRDQITILRALFASTRGRLVAQSHRPFPASARMRLPVPAPAVRRT